VRLPAGRQGIAGFRFEISFEFGIWDLFGNWDLEIGILGPTHYSKIHCQARDEVNDEKHSNGGRRGLVPYL
jgi:hypothetical protein